MRVLFKNANDNEDLAKVVAQPVDKMAPEINQEEAFTLGPG